MEQLEKHSVDLDRQDSKILALHLVSVETTAIGENLHDGQENIEIIES